MTAGRVALLAVALAACADAAAQALVPIPGLEARVTDLTGTLTAQQQTALEQKLAEFQERKGAELALLMLPTTAPEAIEQYSIRVVEAWKLGRVKVDDGALLLVAKNDRMVRIEVGRGLEGVLTDATSNRIIDELIKPRFRQGDFAGGINAGFDQMIKVIDGEPLPPPAAERRPHIPFGVIVALIFLVWFFIRFGGNRWTSGGRGGWGGGFGGGFGGGGFGGGGGGGGFSGGGGSFSGGGASGSW